jgi:nucleotidyltransferase substrate binding protein (TIGR01987 family)
MDRVNQRVQVAWKAFQTLEEILREPASRIVRDAAIQRFEYTYEAAWKAAASYLLAVHGIATAGAKTTVRAAFQTGMLTEEQSRAALLAVEDRNLSTHTYNEAVAEAIFQRLPAHAALIRAWLERMRDPQ